MIFILFEERSLLNFLFLRLLNLWIIIFLFKSCWWGKILWKRLYVMISTEIKQSTSLAWYYTSFSSLKCPFFSFCSFTHFSKVAFLIVKSDSSSIFWDQNYLKLAVKSPLWCFPSVKFFLTLIYILLPQ